MGGFSLPNPLLLFLLHSYCFPPYLSPLNYQVLAVSLLLQHLLGYSLNSTKLRELLQRNADPSVPSVGGRSNTNRNHFLFSQGDSRGCSPSYVA